MQSVVYFLGYGVTTPSNFFHNELCWASRLELASLLCIQNIKYKSFSLYVAGQVITRHIWNTNCSITHIYTSRVRGPPYLCQRFALGYESHNYIEEYISNTNTFLPQLFFGLIGLYDLHCSLSIIEREQDFIQTRISLMLQDKKKFCMVYVVLFN